MQPLLISRIVKIPAPKARINGVEVHQNYSLASFNRAPRCLFYGRPRSCINAFGRLTPEKQESYQLATSWLFTCSYNEDTLQQYLMPHVNPLFSQLPNSLIAIYEKATFFNVLRKMGRVQGSKAIWELIDIPSSQSVLLPG